MMQVIAVIPARYASTRFPGKPLIDIAGKTMIQRVYENVKQVKSLHKVYVATDDSRILEKVVAFGGHAVMTSSFHQSGTERCAEVLSKLEVEPDIVINVQGDEPFIAVEHIQQVIKCFEKSTTQIASLVKPVKNTEDLFNVNVAKVVVNEKMEALYFSRQAIPHLRGIPQQEWHEQHLFYKHIGIYGYRGEVLKSIVALPPSPLEQAEKLEQLRWLENGYTIQMALTQIENMAIDTPEDLQRVLQQLNG
jgi:3-deoxy-manno-octulosonate cytidylyltransferase (CMP-KDO synthetase)